jgi:tRNA threonylcarbamoyladenosine biosynthesis protein TsaE
MEILCKDTTETKKLAEFLAKKLHKNDVIALYGDLGTGKTTFVRYLVEALGFKSRVQSPTFVLSRRYVDRSKSSDVNVINHIDLYRLSNEKDAAEIGITEFLQEPDSITIIEWPEIIESLLPPSTIKIKFEALEDDLRKIYVQNLH